MKVVSKETKTFTFRDEMFAYVVIVVETEGLTIRYDCHEDGSWTSEILKTPDIPDPLKEWFGVIE